MKITRFIAALSLLVAPANVASAQGTKLQPNAVTFKKEVFEQSLTNAVAPNVVGYQYVLIKDGRVVSEKFGGKARRGADGDMDMTATTPINIGSLQKFITGTAMINLMENPAVYSPDRNQSLAVRLKRPMTTLFPAVWLKGMKPGIEKITLGQLLQHRSGFNGYDSGDGEVYKESNRNVLGFLRDADGFLPERYDVRDYANINFVLTGYLLPLYERPDVAKILNNENAESQLNDVMADNHVRIQLGKRMQQMFVERVFSKMKPAFAPSCDAKNVFKATAAYGYKTKTDTTGVLTSSIEKRNHCGGEGGYYMSARDFANYIAHFSATELIVSKEGRDLMFNDKMDPNDRLVWAGSRADNWTKQNFGMPNVATSNGGTDGTYTVLLRLPQNYYLVLFANSNDLHPTRLFDAGLNAFKAGMAHNFT